MNTRFEERLKVIPEIPKEFGEDGGHFYRYYDTLADEIDEDIVKSLKAQLDGILIFAGLFAGVNSAFLALTLPEMSADPADDTNALLLQFVTGGNGSIRSAEDLPSASFSPASAILPINILFSLSLTLALLAAFLAVLGQQWLVYYRKRSGGGAEAQRWEQLRRYLGAKRWRLEAILDDILPSLLQLGLVIFCISFVLYLGTLSRPMCYTIAVPMGLALACIVLMALCAACDHWCPFKSPLSHLFQLTPRPIAKYAWGVVLLLLFWASTVLSKCKHVIISTTGRLGQVAWATIRSCTSRTLTAFISKITQGPIHRSSGGGDTSEDGDTWEVRDNIIPPPPPRTLIAFRRAVRFVSKVTQVPIHLSSEGPELISGSIASWLAANVPRRAEPVGRLKSMAAKRVISTSEDTNALVYAAVNLHAITSPEEAGWLLSDDEFYSRLSEPWRLSYKVIRGIKSSDPQAVEIAAFSNSMLHLILSSPSVAFIFPPDERPLVPSGPLDENNRVIKLSPALHNIGMAISDIASVGVESPCPYCTYCITSSLLRILIESWFTVPQIKLDDWFEQFSTSLMHFTSEPPMLICLLACAVQAYGKLESGTGLTTPENFRKKTWQAVYKMYNIYHKRDISEALDYALEVFPAVDWPARPSDGVCVMLLERAPALLRPSSDRFEDQVKSIAKHAMALFQNIIHRETWNQLHKHTEKDLVARCIKVLVWTFTRVFRGNRARFTVDLSSELKVCLNSAEQISTRKPSTVDVSAFLNFLRIRDELPSPAEYAEYPTRYQYRLDPSSYKPVHDELVTCLARLESAVLAVQRTTDPVMANPADPLPIRVDGRNLPGGKFSCYLPM